MWGGQGVSRRWWVCGIMLSLVLSGRGSLRTKASRWQVAGEQGLEGRGCLQKGWTEVTSKTWLNLHFGSTNTATLAPRLWPDLTELVSESPDIQTLKRPSSQSQERRKGLGNARGAVWPRSSASSVNPHHAQGRKVPRSRPWCNVHLSIAEEKSKAVCCIFQEIKLVSFKGMSSLLVLCTSHVFGGKDSLWKSMKLSF